MGKRLLVQSFFIALFVTLCSHALASTNKEVGTDSYLSSPGERLFSDMDMGNFQLSPDGKLLAFLSPVDGVLNLWVGGIHPDAIPRQLTSSKRAIRQYYWAWNGHQLVYKVDPAGDERYMFVAVDIESGDEINLTPEFGANGHRVATWGDGFFLNHEKDPSRPNKIVVLNNELEEDRNDLWLIDLQTGERELIETGRPGVQRWLVDNNLEPRGFLRGEELGAISLWLRDSDTGEYSEHQRFAANDTISYRQLKFSDDNSSLYMLDATGRDTMALVRLDLESMQREIIAEDCEVDAKDFIFDPQRHIPVAVQFYKGRLEQRALDQDYATKLELVTNNRDEDVYMDYLPGSSTIIAYYYSSVNPTTVKVVDTAERQSYLFGKPDSNTEDNEYCEMQPISLQSRDGLTLHGYLTLPKEYIAPGPLVMLIHGGPDDRDYWGFNPLVQMITSWGYACLQVNFRGSVGYGKSFKAAGNGEWGGAMQDDITDAVAWAIDQGIADAQRIAIMGESYGGYSVLSGLTKTPECYAVGIALNPVSDLEANAYHWDELRPAWREQNDLLFGALPRYASGNNAGEIKDEADWNDEDRALIGFLRQRSPVNAVSNIRVPLLIAQGKADPRVLEVNTTRFVEACRAKGVEIEYLVFEGEGHWLAKPENYEKYYNKAEALLKRTIGEER